jgi:hypothetical protein
VELVVVVKAMVLAAVVPSSLASFLLSSPAFPGASLDVPAAFELAYSSSYSPSVAASASELQPLDLSQPVEDSEGPFLLVVV